MCLSLYSPPTEIIVYKFILLNPFKTLNVIRKPWKEWSNIHMYDVKTIEKKAILSYHFLLLCKFQIVYIIDRQQMYMYSSNTEYCFIFLYR